MDKRSQRFPELPPVAPAKGSDKPKVRTDWLTAESAQRDYLYNLLMAALLSGGATFLLGSYGGLGRRYRESSKGTDIDVDIMNPEVAKALSDRFEAEKEQKKEAQGAQEDRRVAPSTYWTYVLLSLLGGGLGGYALGGMASDYVVGRDLKDRLSKEKKKFERALIEEQLAAARTNEANPYARPAHPLQKAARGKWMPWQDPVEFAKTVGYGWSIPTAVIAYLIFRDYFRKSDPEYIRYSKAKRELQRPMASEPPYAQLMETIPPVAE